MLTLIRWVIVGLGLAAVAVTLLSLTRSSRWPLRIWDFPRVQIAIVAAASGLAYALLFYPYRAADYVFFGIVLLSVTRPLRELGDDFARVEQHDPDVVSPEFGPPYLAETAQRELRGRICRAARPAPQS